MLSTILYLSFNLYSTSPYYCWNTVFILKQRLYAFGRIPTLVCSNVIYKFSCSGCNAFYYGKTNRNLLIRCNEHLGININGRELSSLSPSSIRDHVKQTGHTASFDDFCVISKISNLYDLLIHESLLIQRDKPSLNSQQSSISMVLF